MAHYGLDYGTDHSTHSELPSPDGPDDPETLLNIWLDELDTLTASFDVGFDSASQVAGPRLRRRRHHFTRQSTVGPGPCVGSVQFGSVIGLLVESSR
ncbi:hypothetical protein V9T40_000201 [Parthenolecanium corni]|uniref:Uncharacterized protein n=1 Tax=Parthenolecanium corni TaxID=536013 RepID=A0AAN9T935_9HEMI